MDFVHTRLKKGRYERGEGDGVDGLHDHSGTACIGASRARNWRLGGAASLRDHELLAILLRTGTRRCSALQLAQELLQAIQTALRGGV
jgi:hypothetical protein